MNQTIKAIERHMVQRTTRAQRARTAASSAELAGLPSHFDSDISATGYAAFGMAACHQAGSAKPAFVQPSAPRLIAEWQQRGPETVSGRALRKLRLAATIAA